MADSTLKLVVDTKNLDQALDQIKTALGGEVTDAEGFFVLSQIDGKPLASAGTERLERAKNAIRQVISRRLFGERDASSNG